MSLEGPAWFFPEWAPALAAGGKCPAEEDRQGRLIDLTLTLRPGMRGVEFEPRFNFREHGWNACTLHLYSHCGTHMDAPLHAEAGPGSIDEVPLARCMGPAWVVPLDGIRPRALITVASLGAVAARHAPGDSLLLRTGWSAFIEQPRWRDELPRVSLELARWCVEHQVRMLGVEPPSVADVSNREELVAVHQTLLGGGVLIVEGLTNLGALTQDKVFFVALPLKPLRGDGSPVRAFAILDGRGGIPAAQGRASEGVTGGRDAAAPEA
jgi:kynurenine formamidase